MSGVDRPWTQGERLGPGVYVWNDVVHVDAVELCEHVGVPATRANQEMASRAAERVAEEMGVQARSEWVE